MRELTKTRDRGPQCVPTHWGGVGATESVSVRISIFLPPLRGSGFFLRDNPGFTPGANICRAFGAEPLLPAFFSNLCNRALTEYMFVGQGQQDRQLFVRVFRSAFWYPRGNPAISDACGVSGGT
jgi:hypothetical protein